MRKDTYSFKHLVLQNKDIQADAGLSESRGLGTKDVAACKSFASVQRNSRFPHLLDKLHRQRARECKGD